MIWDSVTWKNDFKVLNKIYVIITWDTDVIKIKKSLNKGDFIYS